MAITMADDARQQHHHHHHHRCLQHDGAAGRISGPINSGTISYTTSSGTAGDSDQTVNIALSSGTGVLVRGLVTRLSAFGTPSSPSFANYYGILGQRRQQSAYVSTRP